MDSLIKRLREDILDSWDRYIAVEQTRDDSTARLMIALDASEYERLADIAIDTIVSDIRLILQEG